MIVKKGIINRQNSISAIPECNKAYDGMKYLRIINKIWFLCAIFFGIAFGVISCFTYNTIAAGFLIIGIVSLYIGLVSLVYLAYNATIDWLSAMIAGFNALNYGVNNMISILNKMNEHQTTALQYICDRLADIQNNQ